MLRRALVAFALVLRYGPRPVLLAREARRRGAAQKKGELRPLIRLLQTRKPLVVVEIGTLRGGTLWLWCRLAAQDALIVSIDLPGGKFGGGYDDTDADLFGSFTQCRQELVLIRKNSHDAATREELVAALGGREIDFLFIDGDHTYEGVKSDFEMYSPLVRAGGLVAFHDIVPDRFETTGEVHIYWNELKQRGYELRELIDRVGSRGYGIGVVFLGGPS